MKILQVFISVLLISLISGCNINLFGSDRPEEISKKNYEMFVESYEVYEERVIKYNGDFLDGNNEVMEFDDGGGGHLTNDSVILQYYDDQKNIEKGKPEKVKLTDKEDQLNGDFLRLYLIKQQDSLSLGAKELIFNDDAIYSDPIKVAVELERKVISTLNLDKTPISLKISVEEETLDYNQKSHDNEENEKSAQEKQNESEAKQAEEQRKEEEKIKQKEQELLEQEKEEEEVRKEEIREKEEQESLEKFHEEEKEKRGQDEVEQKAREKKAEEARKEARERFENESSNF